MKVKQITIRLPEKLARLLKVECAMSGVSQQSVLERGVRMALAAMRVESIGEEEMLRRVHPTEVE